MCQLYSNKKKVKPRDSKVTSSNLQVTHCALHLSRATAVIVILEQISQLILGRP